MQSSSCFYILRHACYHKNKQFVYVIKTATVIVHLKCFSDYQIKSHKGLSNPSQCL